MVERPLLTMKTRSFLCCFSPVTAVCFAGRAGQCLNPGRDFQMSKQEFCSFPGTPIVPVPCELVQEWVKYVGQSVRRGKKITADYFVFQVGIYWVEFYD